MSIRTFGTYPTPVEHLESLGKNLWIKRDDLVAEVYGGNKVRKLERLFAAARDAGKTRILTLGAAGSHQVVATALYGKREGFAVDAVLVPQPGTTHARENLRVAIAHGLRPTVAASWPVAPAMVATRLGGDAYWIPLGGSNALGSLGFVDAATELAGQVSAGVLPEPDVVVVAMGSGGTAAGLAVGFERARMRTKVIGVAISQPAAVLAAMARHVAKKTANLAGLSRAESVRARERIEVDKKWLGRGYGYSTREGDLATQAAAQHGFFVERSERKSGELEGAESSEPLRTRGFVLDATYTAKAFACALDRSRQSAERVLYWHTLSAAKLEPLLRDAAPLPDTLERLFT